MKLLLVSKECITSNGKQDPCQQRRQFEFRVWLWEILLWKVIQSMLL